MVYACLILKGPLQSWGGAGLENPNRDNPRMTELEPTRAGIIGLIRSAYGYGRETTEGKWLQTTKILVRTDSPGRLHRDYQIASLVHHSYDVRHGKDILNREIPKMYLEDATFLVLIEIPEEEIATFEKQLKSPNWTPFLGRKNCVPSVPLYLGKIDTDDPVKFLKDTLPIFWSYAEKNLKQKTVQIQEPQYDITPVNFHPRNQTYKKSVRHATFTVLLSNENAKNLLTIPQISHIKTAIKTKEA